MVTGKARENSDSPTDGPARRLSSTQRSRGTSISETQRRTESVFVWLFVASLLWAPFWFGGNRPFPWGVNAVLFCGLAALYELSIALTGWRRPVSISRVGFSVFTFALVLGWTWVQWTTLTPASLHHPIWTQSSEVLEMSLSGSITVNRDATIIAVLRLLTSASAFWLALQLGRSPRNARLLIEAIAIIGAIYAVYGIIAFFTFPKSILWFEKVAYLDSLTSTFINRNSYATYAALGFLSSVALALSAFQSASYAGDARRRAATVTSVIVGEAGLWLAFAVIIGAALLMTGSRGGITAAFVGLLALLFIFGAQRRGKNSPKLVAGGLAFAMFVGVALSFGDLLAARIDSLGFRSDDRLAVYATTWGSILDRPWLGFGYGTFEHVFPMYRDAGAGIVGTWDSAHNTYLEELQGLGIPAAVLLFMSVGAMIWRCLYGAVTRRRSVTAPLAASAASVTVLTHACVDFSLQIQGLTLTWMALLGAGMAQSWSQEIDTGS